MPGHGLGNWTATRGTELKAFRVRSIFDLPAPPSAPSQGAARVLWLLIRRVQDCVPFRFALSVTHITLFCSLCSTFSARHFFPRGAVGIGTIPFHVYVASHLLPAMLVARGRFSALFPLLS